MKFEPKFTGAALAQSDAPGQWADYARSQLTLPTENRSGAFALNRRAQAEPLIMAGGLGIGGGAKAAELKWPRMCHALKHIVRYIGIARHGVRIIPAFFGWQHVRHRHLM